MENNKQYTKEEIKRALDKVFKDYKPPLFVLPTSAEGLKKWEELFKEYFNTPPTK